MDASMSRERRSISERSVMMASIFFVSPSFIALSARYSFSTSSGSEVVCDLSTIRL